jgi:hypothetical protein
MGLFDFDFWFVLQKTPSSERKFEGLLICLKFCQGPKFFLTRASRSRMTSWWLFRHKLPKIVAPRQQNSVNLKLCCHSIFTGSVFLHAGECPITFLRPMEPIFSHSPVRDLVVFQRPSFSLLLSLSLHPPFNFFSLRSPFPSVQFFLSHASRLRVPDFALHPYPFSLSLCPQLNFRFSRGECLTMFYFLVAANLNFLPLDSALVVAEQFNVFLARPSRSRACVLRRRFSTHPHDNSRAK